MDFRLAPLHSEPEDPPTPRPEPAQTAPKELLKLIKDLSVGEGLEQLFSSTPTKNSFRYCNYKERSDFLRGLTLNFPNITTLHRSVGFIGPCGIFYFNRLNPVFYLFLLLLPPVWVRVWRSEPSGLWKSQTNQGKTTPPSPRFALLQGFMATLRWALSCCWSLLRSFASTMERTHTSPR